MQNIPEDRLRAVLARAAELDRSTHTLEAVRAAAMEAGISRAAVDQALEEFATKHPAITPAPKKESRWTRWLSGMRQAALLAPVCFVVGALANVDAIAAFAWAAFVVAAIRFFFEHRPSRLAGIFQLKVAVMTVFTTLGMASFAMDQNAVMAFIAATGMVVFVVGTLGIKIRIPKFVARLFTADTLPTSAT